MFLFTEECNLHFLAFASCLSARLRKGPSKRQLKFEATGEKRSRAGWKVKTGANSIYVK